MTPLLRRALCAALLVPVALVPACGKKKAATHTGGGDTPPVRPAADEEPGESGDDSPSARRDLPIVTAGWDNLRLAAARQNSQNNLKEIALGMHLFMDANRGAGFPAGVFDASGKKVGLSWRVAILPYIEQETLYRQFKLDEPWDSPTNKKLIGRMPKAYAVHGTDPAQGLTYYRTFAGPGTLFPPPQPGRPGGEALGLRFQQITDGTSNTLLAVEARDPVIWTKPEELVYDPKKPVPELGGVFEKGFNVALCDGSPRFLPRSIDEKTLRGAITANGGEIIKLP